MKIKKIRSHDGFSFHKLCRLDIDSFSLGTNCTGRPFLSGAEDIEKSYTSDKILCFSALYDDFSFDHLHHFYSDVSQAVACFFTCRNTCNDGLANTVFSSAARNPELLGFDQSFYPIQYSFPYLYVYDRSNLVDAPDGN